MKILYHHRIASKDGQYVHVEGLTRALSAQGHELVWVTPGGTDEEEFGGESGLISRLKRLVPGAIYELMEFGYAVFAYLKLARAIRRHSPDVIYERYNLFLPAGVWAARRFGLPLISEVNAPLFEERGRTSGIVLKSLARWSEAYVWRKADAVLPVTEVLADKVRERRGHGDGVTVIHNGIPEAMLAPIEGGRERAKAALGLAGRDVLGFTGFMRDWHGLDAVLHAVAGDPGGTRHALLVGDGPARPGLEALAEDLGITDRVTFTGLVGREDIVRYVSAFDVALQPSVVPYASPLKLFEYMALGKAVVAPDSDNIREVLTDGHDAVLFRRGETDAFAAGIDRVLSDADLRARVEKNIVQTVHDRGHTWEANARRVVAIATELLDAKT
ncbi:MAG: glycosyltransferase family 4 protein [Pseudomonadota bacterium]